MTRLKKKKCLLLVVKKVWMGLLSAEEVLEDMTAVADGKINTERLEVEHGGVTESNHRGKTYTQPLF